MILSEAMYVSEIEAPPTVPYAEFHYLHLQTKQ